MQDQSELQKKIKADETEFLSYWQKIDIIKSFDGYNLEGTLDQPVRGVIINVLSEGRKIQDKHGDEKTLRVMNASQILERINEIAEKGHSKYNIEKIKRSNLYYHLNALEERGFITEVGLIPKKNRLISYYGRTARVFLLKYDDDNHIPDFLTEDTLPHLMHEINPDVSIGKATEMVEDLKKMYQKVDTEPIHEWVRENEQPLRNSEIDIRKLHNTFYKILSFDDETIAAMRAFAKAMKLDI